MRLMAVDSQAHRILAVAGRISWCVWCGQRFGEPRTTLRVIDRTPRRAS